MPAASCTDRLLRPGLVSSVLAAFLASAAAGADAPAKKPNPPGTVDVQPLAGPAVRVRLSNGPLTLVTPYGTLRIPLGDVQRIDFATRVSEDDERRIQAAVTNLGSSHFREREAASEVLIRLAEKAYPALEKAGKSSDAEIRRRAAQLIEHLHTNLPEDVPPFRPTDVVHTAHSKIAGRLVLSELEGRSAQGTVRLRIADLRTLALPEADDLDVSRALPDPGNLATLQNEVGKSYVFKVTGQIAGGFVWGSDIYTSDSSLAIAAVHAGVLKAGQTGFVRVRIVRPLSAYAGTTRHGITTTPYGPWPGAYRVSK
jgi:hypothetical protein